jgi:hypothetical protein
VRTAFLSAAFAGAAALAHAAPALVQEPQPLDPRKNQKIEHLHAEDNAVKIDETRYAGQTESVTVQPKDGMPAYEIVPPSPARAPADDSRRASPSGERVWNVFHF